MRKLQVLTNSEIESFDNCPALHGYGYHELLRPKLTPYRLARGTIGHAGIAAGWRSTLETYFLPAVERVALAKQAARRAVAEAVVKVQGEIRKSVDLEGSDELLNQADESRRICEFACDLYFELRRDELDHSRYVPLAIEAPFEVALRNARGNPTMVLYSGVIDLVLLDVEANSIRIEDHKFPEKPGLSYEKKLPLSTQLTGYVYAVSELVKVPGHPFWGTSKERCSTELWSAQVGAIAYNLLKAKLPATPSINQNGMVSVAKLDTTPELYADALFEQRASRNLEISQKQREFLESLRTRPPWITKLEYYRGEDELQRWLAETCVKAAQIRETERRSELRVRRSGHCTGTAAPRCAFDSVCMDPTSQHTRDTFYRVATSRHEEIEVEQHGSEKEVEPW